MFLSMYCAITVHFFLNQDSINDHVKRVHREMFIMLLVEALCPILFLQLPLATMCLLLFTGSRSTQTLSYIVGVLLSTFNNYHTNSNKKARNNFLSSKYLLYREVQQMMMRSTTFFSHPIKPNDTSKYGHKNITAAINIDVTILYLDFSHDNMHSKFTIVVDVISVCAFAINLLLLYVYIKCPLRDLKAYKCLFVVTIIQNLISSTTFFIMAPIEPEFIH
ncbi:hypothetical protein OESDEN_04327 [Oesophagostomum dentatum]|uniref:Uncharacterized protein n=1 Tax=Oesophagostomum dentatum TaxID=61180 RepID=A0A0B1TI17_OESDE|nr:hypothetical protein OESDEN_04327 [Oesophagostomum dentatum]